PETASLFGLLSGIADVLGTPRAELADQMPLAPEVADALRGDDRSPLSRVLRAVEAYEAGDPQAGVRLDNLGPAYLELLRWSNQLIAAV
ncbi:MAG TPA: hypothetical protein VN408_22270, partial [Actinoplanes sp.]|nr:hypothetical protein [Actinoplanes sp.]